MHLILKKITYIIFFYIQYILLILLLNFFLILITTEKDIFYSKNKSIADSVLNK